MFTPQKLRVIGIVVGCVVLTASGVWNSSGDPTKAGAEEVKDARLKELQTEKLATLKEVVSLTDRGYRDGLVSYDQHWVATKAMYHAELDFCETDKERIQTLDKLLTAARENEERRINMNQAATGNFIDVLRSKAERLDVEIALQRAKAK